MAKRFNVFDYKDYKQYLRDTIDARSLTEKGQRLKLAAFINCKPSYISQILNEGKDLSPEQAHDTNEFLGHTKAEAKYFFALVLHSRAGTQKLKKLYADELKTIHEQQLIIMNRVQANRVLNDSEQAQYYSAWYYAAIHVVVSLAQFRKKELIANALGLPVKTVSEVVEFLVRIGILKVEAGELRQGETSLFIGVDSPFLNKHLSNWRMQALHSLDAPAGTNMHYSGVITCSHDDAAKIKERLVQTIQEIRKIVKDSKDEGLCVYNLDLFSLLE